jgi:hypothetical protein
MLASLPLVTETELTAFFRAIDGTRGPLEPNDPKFVSGLYDTGDDDPMEVLERRIVNADRSTVNYFTGQRGTGKSTQLRLLKTKLAAKGCAVVLVDMAEYLPENEPLDVTVLLVALVAAIADHVENDYNQDLLNQPIHARLWAFLKTEIKLESVEGSAPGVKLKAAFEASPNFREMVRKSDETKKAKYIKEGLELIAQFSDFLRERTQKQKVVFLVDSLERLRDPVTNENGIITDSVIKVFDEERASLEIGGTNMVYSVPPYVTSWSNLGGVIPVTALGSVRVYKEPPFGTRIRRPNGHEKMRELLEKRYPDWEKVLTRNALDQLIAKSGGDVRQFLFRLVGAVVEKAFGAQDRLPFKPADRAIKEVLRRAQTEYEVLVVGSELPLLASISKSNKAAVEDRAQIRVLARFFENRALLSYQNGDAWVNASPLLWDRIDEYIKQSAPTDTAAQSV